MIRNAHQHRTLILAALVAFALVLIPAAASAPGDLDPSFGSGGTVTTLFCCGALAHAVATQSDGKIVAAGSSLRSSYGQDFALTRYNRDGSLDPGFGSSGKVTTPIGSYYDAYATARAVAIQSDGKIVAAGSIENAFPDTNFALVRYNPDGTPDQSFGTHGIVTTPVGPAVDIAYAVAVQSDGKIVAAGYTDTGPRDDFALVRYKQDGSLDTSFGSGGIVKTAVADSGQDIAQAVAIQPDGKIVAGGSGLARYNTDGSLDSSFGTGGTVKNVSAGSLALQADGKIVVAGSGWQLQRFNENGSLDQSFGTGGWVNTRFGPCSDTTQATALQADGKIVAAGWTMIPGSPDDCYASGYYYKFAVARYNADGSLDPGFGSGGKVTTAIGSNATGYATAIEPDGRIVVAGSGGSGFGLARYLAYAPDGSGTITGAPTSVRAGSEETVSFTYTAAEGGTGKGELRLTVPSGWTAPQKRNPDVAGYVTSDSGTLSISGRVISVSKLTLAGGGSVHILYRAATARTPGISKFQAQQRSAAGGLLTDLASSALITVSPGAAKELVFRHMKETLQVGRHRTLRVKVEDVFGNGVPSPRWIVFAKSSGRGKVTGLRGVRSGAAIARLRITAVRTGRITLVARSHGLTRAKTHFKIVR